MYFEHGFARLATKDLSRASEWVEAGRRGFSQMEHSTHDNTLVLSGALDVRCTAELRAMLYALLGTTSGDVRVDIERVDTIDMTTLKMLAVANRSAEREGRRVVLCSASTGVRRLLHISHLRQMLTIEPQQAQRTAS